jgi:WD40 repeat protein
VEIFDLTVAQVSIPAHTCGSVIHHSWSPDGKRIAFGENCPPEYAVKVIDTESGEILVDFSAYELFSGEGDINTVLEWSPDGERLLITYADQTARIWDAASAEQLLSFTGHNDQITDGTWSPDSRWIVTCDLSGNVIVWDATSGVERTKYNGEIGEAWHAIWSPDGNNILITSYTGEAIIWDVETGEVLQDLIPGAYGTFFTAAAWIKNGQRIFLLSSDGVVHIFNSHSGEKLNQFTTPESLVSYLSLSPSAERALISGYEGAASVWDTEIGTEVLRYDVGGFALGTYSPDGSRVVITNTEGDTGLVQIFPTWHSPEELVTYARECCLVRELTADERETFGLPPK